MRKKLETILDNAQFLTDKQLESALINLIYEKNKDNTLNLFLRIQELDKERIQKENNRLYRGLESGMHMFSSLSRSFLESKSEASSYLKEALDGDNISHLIIVCKSYFPKGKSDGASNNGKWFFSKFTDMLVKHRKKYEDGGEYYSWAKNQGHTEYINLVLENIDKADEQ